MSKLSLTINTRGPGHTTIILDDDPDLLVRRSCTGTWRAILTDAEFRVTSDDFRALADLMDADDAAQPQRYRDEGGDADVPAWRIPALLVAAAVTHAVLVLAVGVGAFVLVAHLGGPACQRACTLNEGLSSLIRTTIQPGLAALGAMGVSVWALSFVRRRSLGLRR